MRHLLDQVLLHRLVAELARAGAIGRAVDGRVKLGGIQDRVDLRRPAIFAACTREPHRAEAEDPDRALLDRRRLAHGAEAGGDAAAEEADRPGRAGVNLRARDSETTVYSAKVERDEWWSGVWRRWR